MKKVAFAMLFAGNFALFSCNKTEKTESDTAVVTQDNDTGADMETATRERASAAANQMAQDLKVDADTAWQRKASNVYYTRATRRYETRGKYNTDTTGMAAALREIDREADLQFREMLQPEQYKVYETNRTTYYGGFEETDMPSVGYDSAGSTSASAGGSGLPAGAKVKTKVEKDGDTKTEIETATSETKIKTEDGQTKIKTKQKD